MSWALLSQSSVIVKNKLELAAKDKESSTKRRRKEWGGIGTQQGISFKLILAVSTAYLFVKPGQMLVATAEKNISPQDSVIRMTEWQHTFYFLKNITHSCTRKEYIIGYEWSNQEKSELNANCFWKLLFETVAKNCALDCREEMWQSRRLGYAVKKKMFLYENALKLWRCLRSQKGLWF